MKIKGILSLAFIALILCLIINQADAREPSRTSTLEGRIVEVNEEYRFVVINLGSADGVKKDMLFSVFQKEEEIAKIKVANVRRHISACYIQLFFVERPIGRGDLAIYRKVFPLSELIKPLKPSSIIESKPIIVDIDAPKQTILTKALTVFKEFNVIVTRSDPSAHLFKAYKNIDLPLIMGLYAEGGFTVRNKVYYTVEIVSRLRCNRMIIHLKAAYDSEGQSYNYKIKRNSSTYKEIQEMAFAIKDLSEEM